MGDKLKEIRETTSDAVSIIRELGSPGVQESLGRILETTKAAKEIVDAFKEPEFVKNVQNIRLTTDSIRDTSVKLETTIREMKQTGVIEQAREVMRSIDNVLSTLSSNEDFTEGTEIMKATLTSIRDLVDELRLLVISSKKTGTLSNAAAIMKESSDVYRNISG